ncbi:divergent polysaccharide deacetylase family protein [Serratia liquefaciens]|uniref:divergent polysaccharide deacetylase family protein n=1 Tax=Serratia liquefaciens TaxID=614 RepID=UPI0018E44DB4|nr:divergent polysaccharide deacetylase family protein [Serratia liquefaciens]MBI6164385.1 divergent polysaccharide deacetylase family protein [Serratia liquefaciens]
MRYNKIHTAVLIGCLLQVCAAQAGKLSIVIDDVGYRPHEEGAVLQMPTAISVAVLPNAPHARLMATRAHSQGREVLIHMPMAPLSKQPLERDTLQPSMSSEEIQRIIRNAVNNVPYAVGMNNHMGSAMTSSLPGMQKVMQALDSYQLYFLDSMTIGNSQATRAAAGTHVKVIKRKVFLDDTASEADIRRQFNRAVELARRNGSAIAIGHPRPATVKVLQQMLPTLPSDIILVKPSSLLNEPQGGGSGGSYVPPPVKPQKPQPKNPFNGGIKQCKVKLPKEKVNAGKVMSVIGESVTQSPAVTFIKRQWQRWTDSTPDKPKA